jgi:hypothetical protein
MQIAQFEVRIKSFFLYHNLPIPKFPVLLHSQIERRRAPQTSRKKIPRRPWFLQKAPYLCTPPESTGFTASKPAFIAAMKVEK